MKNSRRSLFERNYIAAARNISAAMYRSWKEKRRRKANRGNRQARLGFQDNLSARRVHSDPAIELIQQKREIEMLSARLETLKQIVIDRDALILQLVTERIKESQR